MKHPILFSKTGFIIYLLVWIVNSALLFWLLWYLDAQNPIDALIDTMCFMVPLFVIGLSIWFVVRYSDIESVGVAGLIIHHIAAAAIVVGLWMSVTYYCMSLWFGESHSHMEFVDSTFHWFVLGGGMTYLFLVLFYYLMVYYQNFKEKLQHESDMENLLKEAELNALKSQINPHFLFNSLNSVSALTLTKPESAREMVVKLSSYLRYSIAKDLKEYESLENELSSNRLYLEIEKVRFGERLQLTFDIDAQCAAMLIPNLILQPIYENAIKHGVHESTDPITITTKCDCKDGNLRVSIANNFDPEALPRKGNGIGLKNIQDRLQLIYNRSDLMQITKKNDFFKVNLEFPQ